MSTLPAKLTERNPDQPDGPDPVCIAPPSRTCGRKESLPLRPGRRRMRVRLCSRCPYTPRDLAGHYDPEAVLHVCARCDGEREASTNHYPRKTYRRQKCATVPSIPAMAQRSVARSATESLASSGTTRGEPLSVQESALTASRPAWTATADGYVDFSPPDNGRGETPAAPFRSSGFNDPHPAETVFCFALGGAA
jgi:hypothetical protein